MFGVGGGFLLTPLLIFIGVPPAVAVASSANQLVGASVSGVLAHWRRGNVDFKMGFVLLLGGLAGSVLGVWLFTLLKRLGQIELTISLLYVLLLGTLGALMLIESVRTLLRQRRPGGYRRKLHQHNWLHGLPLKTRFRRSKLYISALLPIGLGFLVGILERGPRHRRRLRAGAGDDLHARHADRGGARHLAVADHLRRRQRDLPAGLYQPHRRRGAGDGAAGRRA